MTDFRALCAELADELEGWISYGDESDIADAHELVDRARAALAEPEGPTDEELASHLISAGVDAMEGEHDGTGRMYWKGWNEQVMAAMHAAIFADRARRAAAALHLSPRLMGRWRSWWRG